MTGDDRAQFQNLLARCWRCIVASNGGPEAERMCEAYFRRGLTYAEIAREHDTSKSVIHHKVHRLHSALAEFGIVPETWRTRSRVREITNKPTDSQQSIR